MNKILIIAIAIFSFGSLNSQESLNVELLYNWQNDSLPSSFFFNNAYNEVWGYSAEGREYAIIGSTMGTHIFDITDPTEAEEIHFIEGAQTGGSIVHRDFDDYDGYLYAVCDEGISTLQIIDLHNLPEEAPVVYDSNDLFSKSHNIFIDKDNSTMYMCGGTSYLRLYDLTDPLDPQFIIDCGESIEGWYFSAGYIHDIYVREGIAYCNAGTNGLYVVDFTDPLNASFIGSLTDYEDSGYNHSGWLHPDGEIYALADETHGTRIKLLDVSDPSDIEVVSLIGSEVTENSIVHNLIFEGNLLHVSYYYDGYYVFDISDVENPEMVAFYDTSTEVNLNSYKGAWGVFPMLPSGNVLVSDMQEGLFVFQLDIPSGIDEESSHNLEINVYPNPISEADYIRVSGLPVQSKWNYELMNQQGSIVLKGTLNPSENSKIFLTAQAQGIYYLTLHSGQESYNVKVVKI